MIQQAASAFSLRPRHLSSHMSKTIAISMIGGVIAGGSLPAAPGAPAAISVSGFIDPISNTFTITVNVTPPATLGTFLGAHLFLEIPDQSSVAPFKIGSSVIGDGSATTGAWFFLDLGKFPFSESEPWVVSGPAPATVDGTQDIPCRLYANPYSAINEPALIQANQAGASPNVTFTLVSLASGSPTSGTNTTAVSGAIVATVLSPVNVSGKLQTPVLVDVSTVPNAIPGWAFQLVLTYGTADPTIAANQFVVSSVQNQAGPVQPASADGISIPHSFELDTPTTLTSATVWCQSGLIGSDNSFTPNNIVPSITPMWPITYGSTTGTTDASSVMAATIAASMAVVNGLFGVAAGGITNPLLGTAAVATINVQALAITNPLLASLCVAAANMATNSVTAANGALAALAVVAANLANSSVTAVAIATAAVGSAAIANLAVGTAAIQTSAITNALIANAAISDAKIQTATITGASIATATIAGANIGTATISQTNMASASIGTAQIQSLAVTNAKINDLSVAKLTAGMATFTGTVTFAQASSASQVVITSSSITIATNAVGSLVLSSTGDATFTSAATSGSTVISGGTITGTLAVEANITITPGSLTVQNGANVSVLGPSSFSMNALPSSSPGAGSKQFWYDPSDGDRVKYAP
jgi:hypothetical protein